MYKQISDGQLPCLQIVDVNIYTKMGNKMYFTINFDLFSGGLNSLYTERSCAPALEYYTVFYFSMKMK